MSDSGSGSHCPQHRSPGFWLCSTSSLAKGTERASNATPNSLPGHSLSLTRVEQKPGGQAPRRHRFQLPHALHAPPRALPSCQHWKHGMDRLQTPFLPFLGMPVSAERKPGMLRGPTARELALCTPLHLGRPTHGSLRADTGWGQQGMK